MSAITTHVLDTAHGRPADGVEVTLSRRASSDWRTIGTGVTDADGRVGDLLSDGQRLDVAVYRLRFAVARYFARDRRASFYPHVDVVFEVARPDEHHHVPILLSPFGYSTYRGS